MNHDPTYPPPGGGIERTLRAAARRVIAAERELERDIALCASREPRALEETVASDALERWARTTRALGDIDPRARERRALAALDREIERAIAELAELERDALSAYAPTGRAERYAAWSRVLRDARVMMAWRSLVRATGGAREAAALALAESAHSSGLELAALY